MGAHDGLGVVGDAEGGRADHLEIVGAVACGDGLFERGARLMAEDLERAALAVGVEDAGNISAGL